MPRHRGTFSLISGFKKIWFRGPRGGIQEDLEVFQPFSSTFLCPIHCGEDGRIWPRSMQLLPRACPMHKEHNRRPHDPPIPCTTCLGHHPTRECRSCSWVHWGGECGVIIYFVYYIVLTLFQFIVYIVFISIFIIHLFIVLYLFHFFIINCSV